MAAKLGKINIIKNAIRRFHHLPKQTIARHILNTHGELFDNDLDKIRHAVRYWMGACGNVNRKKQADKSFFYNTPTKLPPTWKKNRPAYKLPVGVWLVLSDLHIPFHDITAVEAAIQAGQAEKVNGVFFNGDLQDCASVSYWPTARRDFNWEVELVIDFLDFIGNEFKGKKIVYKPGNHEYRLPRAFVSKMPELAESPLAAMETVMGLEKRGIEFLDYHQLVYAGKLPIIHGHEVQSITRSVNPARGLFLRTKTFSACSHCHSTSEHTPKTIEGKLLTTWSFGCLCDLQPEYAPYGNDWNHGFAIINVDKNGDFEVVNRRILPNGKVV